MLIHVVQGAYIKQYVWLDAWIQIGICKIQYIYVNVYIYSYMHFQYIYCSI